MASYFALKSDLRGIEMEHTAQYLGLKACSLKSDLRGIEMGYHQAGYRKHQRLKSDLRGIEISIRPFTLQATSYVKIRP